MKSHGTQGKTGQRRINLECRPRHKVPSAHVHCPEFQPVGPIRLQRRSGNTHFPGAQRQELLWRTCDMTLLKGLVKHGKRCSLRKVCSPGASLVVQWLGIHSPVQGTRALSLIWEDPACRRATKPLRHDYWASAAEPRAATAEARMPGAWAPREKPPPWDPRTQSSLCVPPLEEAHAQQSRPLTAKNNK